MAIEKESMGNTVRSNSNISRVDVSKSPSGKEQSVVYSTHDSRTCTLLASVGVDTSSVSLRDYTFEREGTRVDIRVSGSDVGAIDIKYGGSALEVRKDAGQFSIGYGVPNVRCGFLVVSKHDTATHGGALFVTHMYGTAEQRLSLAVVQVWYDAGKGAFMCNVAGPSRHSSLLDAVQAMSKAYGASDVAGARFSTGQQTNITGLINNTGGPVNGHLNGSMLNNSTINFFTVYLNYK